MDLGLKGKIALVTGASSGLGFATALQLAKEGAQVVINSRNPEHLSKAAMAIQAEIGQIPGTVAADMSAADAAEEVIRYTITQLGGLDVLICNAGGPPAGGFEDFDDATWLKAIDLSFMSNVRLIRAALPYLRKSATPSVLTITSYSVKQPIPNLILSNSIRSATIGLTKSLALDLGGENIRFNSILPAWTETERVANLMDFRAKSKGTTVAEEMAHQAKETALGRIANPQEFANAAVFLVSPAASYITGVMLSVDGGAYKATY